jgi:hypothetical protein
MKVQFHYSVFDLATKITLLIQISSLHVQKNKKVGQAISKLSQEGQLIQFPIKITPPPPGPNFKSVCQKINQIISMISKVGHLLSSSIWQHKLHL